MSAAFARRPRLSRTPERPVTDQRLRQATTLSALLIGGALAAAFAGVAAQDAAGLSPLRGTASGGADRAIPDDPARAALRRAAPAGAGPRARAPGQPAARRARARRSVSPTVAPVRAITQAPVVSPNLLREVQPPLTGIPDPTKPLPLPRRLLREDDPYGQVGYRVGGLNLYPSIQESVGYDSNPNRLHEPPKGSFMSRTEGELRLRSDWSNHELAGYLRGAYNIYPDVKGADRPDGDGALRLRLDASRDTKLDVEGHYRLETQRPGSPELNAPVLRRPLVWSFGASVGATQAVNRLQFELRGGIDRRVYEDADLPGGVVLRQGDRNFTQPSVRLRAGYELTPGLKPFAEAIVDARVYDQVIDNTGFRRSSDGLGLRAGSTFEFTRTLVGEASAGVQTRRYEDPRLRDLRGPLIDAALIWSATPLTTVRLRAQATVDETTLPFSSGALTRRVTAEVQHDLRRNLSLIGALTVGETDYRGVTLRERGLTGAVRLEYKLTRAVVLRASFTHERLKSTSPGADYTANTYLVGLRFQP